MNTYIPEYKYNHKVMGELLEALFAITTLEKYYYTNNIVIYEDTLMDMTIKLLVELSILLGRNVEQDQPYCFEQEGDTICVYNYDTKIHSDINLIYKIVDY